MISWLVSELSAAVANGSSLALTDMNIGLSMVSLNRYFQGQITVHHKYLINTHRVKSTHTSTWIIN